MRGNQFSVSALCACFMIVTAGLAFASDESLSLSSRMRDEDAVLKTLNPQERQSRLDSRLLRAARHGRVEWANYCLQKGANVNTADGEQMTPLMYAALLGQREIVSLLISAGADLDAADVQGVSALMHASWSGHVEIANDLIEAGALVNLKEITYSRRFKKRASDALMAASAGGSAETVQLLLANGANVDQQDDDGESALFHAVRKNDRRVISMLLNGGAWIESRDKYRLTPLMAAAIYADPETVRLLLRYGANRNAVDMNKLTAAEYAKQLGRNDIYLVLSDSP